MRTTAVLGPRPSPAGGREPAGLGRAGAGLASAYASGRVTEAWEQLRRPLGATPTELRGSLERPVQTNEVGRCAALLFGFLAVAAETRLPLRLLEVGASAGLNLRWDRYRYQANGFSWGPDDSPVRLAFELDGKQPPRPPQRRDRQPQRLRRRSDRSDHSRGPPHPAHLHLARPAGADRPHAGRARGGREGAGLARPRGCRTLGRRMLAEQTPGETTVIYHSIVSQYLSDEERVALFDCIETPASAPAPTPPRLAEDGAQRRPRRPPPDHLAGGEERRLARVGYHGSRSTAVTIFIKHLSRHCDV